MREKQEWESNRSGRGWIEERSTRDKEGNMKSFSGGLIVEDSRIHIHM